MIRKMMLSFLGVGLAGGLPGCYANDCRDSYTCPESPVIAEPSCDPASGIHATCAGVFVSSTLGSDDNPGTVDRPVRSLSKAINAARTGARRVHACAETFAESVVIPAGMEIWGGLDCTAGWAYVGESHKTTITAGPGEIPLRFVPGTGRAVVADVHARAADADQPGGSSIAVLIGADAAVEILRSQLVAGNGAPGAAGTSGGDLSAPAGEAGSTGGAACTAGTVQGGAGAQNSCQDHDSAGGLGGVGGPNAGGDGANGTPEPYPNSAGLGLGGAGWTSGIVCSAGSAGADGEHGKHGAGASGSGSPTAEGWQGVPGHDGGHGRPGQGGGGGGGSRGGALACGAALGGASGGGGGAGGCGGTRGEGGGYGGASIGVLTLSGDVTIRATSIQAARGGDGGRGGLGQIGGIGGTGGPGGAPMNSAAHGCYGGDGGYGGNGGHGGGGLGGPSIGVAYPHPIAPVLDADIRVGEPGKGGLGGDPNLPGSAGEAGLRGELVGFPP